jgi:two-component system phosphate regulon sensor histidine kinase PhoR
LSSFDWILLAALLTAVVVLGWRFWVALAQIRAWIARLACGDFRIVIVDPPFGLFRRTSRHLREITENLRRQSRQISEEGFSLKAILGSMVEGVMLVDASLHIRMANDPLCKMFGFSISPMDRNVTEVFHLPELRDCLNRTFASGEEQHIALTISEPVFSTGKQSSFEIYAAPLNSENHRVIRGAVVVFHDVTKVKASERMRREFVANVSHEFRTPLAIIGGYLETLREDGFADKNLAGEAVEIMARHCDRLNRLIGDLLVISRLEQQKIDLQPRAVRLDEILERVLNQVVTPALSSQPEIQKTLDPDALEIEADPWRLEQVFTNLISNAMRYGVQDGRAAKIHLALQRKENIVEFRCRDEGPGIPFPDQPHIFERFYRVHKDRSRDAGGTGLGLSIVKNIVLVHGGSVDLESTPGQGATFIVRLPRLRPRIPLPSAPGLSA